MLEHARGVGPVTFRWEWAVMFGAVSLLASSLFLFLLQSTVASVAGVVMLGVSLLLFQLLLHECAHRSLFRSRWMNTVTGWLMGLWCLMPFFSFRRGHAVHHSSLGVEGDPTAAPRDARRQSRLLDMLVWLRVVPILYLGGVYGPYLLFDFRQRSHQPRRCLVVYTINLLAILLLHLTLAWSVGWNRYPWFLLAAFWLSGVFYEYLFTQHQHIGLLPGPETPDRFSHRQQVNCSRSIRLPGAGMFLFFHLHKEHHLFPQLPCRYLPRIHQWLQENRSDVLGFTSEYLGVLRRRRHLNLHTPTAGDHDESI